ncbi:MAG: CynX/NimT family MFS transporter, partial [Actinomycetes bacterium]
MLLALNLRSGLIVVSPLLQQIRTDLGMSPAMAGVLGAVPPTAFAVLGWMTASVVRWVGLERVAWVAVLVTGGCQLLRPLADGAWEFLGLSALAYAGMGAGNVLLPPLVKRHFPDRMGPVSGMYILLISVGTVAPALVAVPTAELTGWRIAAGAWGVVALSAAVPWLAVDRRVDRRAVLESVATARRYIPVTALLRSQLALGLVGVFGLNSLNAYAMFAWLPSILVESGIDALSAGRYLSLFATMA